MRGCNAADAAAGSVASTIPPRGLRPVCVCISCPRSAHWQRLSKLASVDVEIIFIHIMAVAFQRMIMNKGWALKCIMMLLILQVTSTMSQPPTLLSAGSSMHTSGGTN